MSDGAYLRPCAKVLDATGIKCALDRHAAAIILVHNHPSGRCEPSAEDRGITAKLQSACSAVSVNILDPITAGDSRHFSFNERGLL